LNGKEVIGTQDEHVSRYKIMMILVHCNISIASINYSASIYQNRKTEGNIKKKEERSLFSGQISTINIKN
jgi:hypothetical protein